MATSDCYKWLLLFPITLLPQSGMRDPGLKDPFVVRVVSWWVGLEQCGRHPGLQLQHVGKDLFQEKVCCVWWPMFNCSSSPFCFSKTF